MNKLALELKNISDKAVKGYRINPKLWDILTLEGIDLKVFRFSIHVSDVTWVKIKKGKPVDKKQIVKLQKALKGILDERIFHMEYVEEVIDEIKQNHKRKVNQLRSAAQELELKGKCNKAEIAKYLGVSRQYISNFFAGSTIKPEKSKLLENFINLFKY